MTDNHLEIVMASDDHYSGILAIALYSLFKCNRAFSFIRVHVIDDRIRRERKEELLHMAQQFGRELLFLPAPKIPPELKVQGALNVSTYYRLFLTELLPGSLEKVLYLDCDIMVRDSLEELWRTELGETWIGGMQDTTGRDSRRSVGLADNIYVNAGVLLVNLRRWRSGNFLGLALQYLESMKWSVPFNDQGVLNHVCEGRKTLIAPAYNFMRPYERFEREQLQKLIQGRCLYPEEELTRAKSNPAIVHFSGYPFSRPWFEGARGRYVEEYRRVVEESGIALPLFSQPETLKYRLRKAIDLLPDGLSIWATNRVNSVFYLKLRLQRLFLRPCRRENPF